MKKYLAPVLETLSFGVDEAITNALPSSLFNDGEFGGW